MRRSNVTRKRHLLMAPRAFRRDALRCLSLPVGAEDVREIGAPVDRLKPLVSRGSPTALPTELLRQPGSLFRFPPPAQDSIAASIRRDEIFAGKAAKRRPRPAADASHRSGRSS